MPWQRDLALLKAIVKKVLRKVRVLPNLTKSELMLHKPEKISLIRLYRNLQVSRCSVLFQIHQMLFQTELSPIQEDRGITRNDKIRDSQPCSCLCYLCLPAVFEPQCLQFLNPTGLLKTVQLVTGMSLATGWKSSKWLKFTMRHLSGGKKARSGAELDCFFALHEWKSSYVLADS